MITVSWGTRHPLCNESRAAQPNSQAPFWLRGGDYRFEFILHLSFYRRLHSKAIHLASQIALSCHDIAPMDPNSQYSSGLSGFPALLPPPGVSSDFIHPKSIGQRVTIASTICLTLMTLCVIVRFYTKLFIKHVWGWDDCEPLFHCKLNLLMASRFLYTCNGKERCRGFYSHPSQMWPDWHNWFRSDVYFM